MTLLCKPVCWLYGLKIRRIDRKVRWIHDRYRLSETALRWHEDRASRASMCRSTEELPDCPTLDRKQVQELQRLCRLSPAQLSRERQGLTEEHRHLQDRRVKFASWQRSHGSVPVAQFLSML